MIETERLTLRPFIEADRGPLAEIHADPRVTDWLGGPMDRAATDALIDRVNAHIAEHGFGFWAAERKADRRLVGMIGLVTLGADLPPAPGVEMGWRLAADVHGQGLATEGAAAAMAWGFANLPVDEIVAFTAETNAASQAVMRRIGMMPDTARDFDHPRLAPDHPLRRHVLFAKTRT